MASEQNLSLMNIIFLGLKYNYSIYSA